MPMAARMSAQAPKMVRRSMLKSWRAVERTTISIHGADAGDGEAAAGLTKLLGNGGDELMRIAVGADEPGDGTDAGVERGHAIGDLSLRNDHERAGIAIEAAIADVSDDADDLAGGLFKLRADAFADDDLLADGILFGPVLLGHGLIDDDDAGAAPVILIGEVAAAENGNFEDGEIAGRSAHPAGAAGVGIFAGRAADDVEGQAEAAFERQAAGGGGDFDAGNGVEALAAIADELGDAGGLLKALAGERHFQGEDVVRIEAGIDVAQGDEGADEQRGADEENEGEGDFADDQKRAGLALAESCAGAVAAFLERGVEVGARGADGGEEPEENAGEQRRRRG